MRMYPDLRPLVIVEPRPAQALVVQSEPQRFDQMQAKAGIGAKADYIAGVWRNFRLEKHNIKHQGHGLGYLETNTDT